jgi:ABC-type multidrug transport system fused ATPase/permease subunit
VLLEGVRFGYPGGSGPVLDGLDLRVDPGEQVALVGRSGAGKSTVVELLQAFVRPQVGRVVVGGLDLAAAPLDAVRAQVAVVAQSTYLFTGTLAENLRVASAEADDDALWEALRTAHLADDVLRLPDRLDTRVGERGLALSGGQAQRVAIARAVLYPAPVLVLDEPTSQVDLASERAILAALAELRAGRTVLTIAHRLSTVADADRMYLLSGGRATEIDPRRYLAAGGRR